MPISRSTPHPSRYPLRKAALILPFKLSCVLYRAFDGGMVLREIRGRGVAVTRLKHRRRKNRRTIAPLLFVPLGGTWGQQPERGERSCAHAPCRSAPSSPSFNRRARTVSERPRAPRPSLLLKRGGWAFGIFPLRVQLLLAKRLRSGLLQVARRPSPG